MTVNGNTCCDIVIVAFFNVQRDRLAGNEWCVLIESACFQGQRALGIRSHGLAHPQPSDC